MSVRSDKVVSRLEKMEDTWVTEQKDRGMTTRRIEAHWQTLKPVEKEAGWVRDVWGGAPGIGVRKDTIWKRELRRPR